MKLRYFFLAGLVLALGAAGLRAQALELATVPADWPQALQDELNPRRAELQSRWDGFLAHRAAFVSAFTGTKAGTPQAAAAEARKGELKQEVDAIVDDADHFNERVAEITRQRAAVVPVVAPVSEGERVIAGILALARELGWDDKKQARLETALHDLGGDGVDTNAGEVQQAWRDILGRRQDADLMAAAALGDGPGWPSSGVQTNSSDCAIFALANATGEPYGVMAARATKLLSEGTWRSDADRAHPQAAIERAGLNGGEVIMLAEIFGQAEVVQSGAFAETLRAGRPIMINVIPSGGRGAHEVVLTKSFSHGGETWFEMMESYQGPTTRLYLRKPELDIILQERGVAFRHEPGHTPPLFK
jgi:hypothetical protein